MERNNFNRIEQHNRALLLLRALYDLIGYTTCIPPNEKPLIVVHYDKSTFYANADQAFYWSHGSGAILKQKSLGQSIMISYFIEGKSCDFLHKDGVKDLTVP